MKLLHCSVPETSVRLWLLGGDVFHTRARQAPSAYGGDVVLLVDEGPIEGVELAVRFAIRMCGGGEMSRSF